MFSSVIRKTALTVLICCAIVSSLYAQFPDTLSIPVTYYDFHSEGSCPDFNPVVSNDFIILNTVNNTLDNDGRPVRGIKTGKRVLVHKIMILR